MKRKLKSGHTRLKTKLGLPDLEHAKIAVIVSLRSFESQRSHRHLIDEFVAWYCSAPRLSFNKAVVLRYRLHLTSRGADNRGRNRVGLLEPEGDFSPSSLAEFHVLLEYRVVVAVCLHGGSNADSEVGRTIFRVRLTFAGGQQSHRETMLAASLCSVFFWPC